MSNPMPDIADVITVYRKLRQDYGRLRERQMLHDKLYWCEFDLGLDKDNFRSMRLPKGRQMVENPVNHIAMDKLTVNRAPKLNSPYGVETKKARELADRLERWLQAILDDISHVQPYFLRELVKGQSWRGEGYLKPGLAKHFLEWMRAGGGEVYEGNPFVFDTPDSGLVYASLDMEHGCLPYDAFEERILTVRQFKYMMWEKTKKEFTLPSELQGLQESDKLNLIQWWRKEAHGYFASDIQAGTYATISINGNAVSLNPAGFVPYCRAFSGFGHMPDDGDPAKIAVGTLTGWEDTLVGHSRLYSMMDTITSKFAAPVYKVHVAEGVTVEGRIQLSPGTVWIEREGTELKLLEGPVVNPTVMMQLEKLEKEFESFMPGVTSGAAKANEAAISLSTRLNQAGLLWENMYISSRRTIETALSLILRLMVEVVKVPVEIRGLRLSPEDIQEYYDVGVDIKPGNPDDLKWDALLGLQLWEKGAITFRQLHEVYLHDADATQAEIDRAVEDIAKTDPQYKQAIMQEALRQVEAKWQAKALSIGGTQPGGAPPPMPGAFPGAMPGPQAPPVPGALPGVGGSPGMGIPAIPAQETQIPDIAKMRQMVGR